MTNVGALNATLTLSAFEFNSGLQRSSEAAMQFATTTEVASARATTALHRVGKSAMSGGMNATGAAMAVQQIGFGIQDFSSQFATRGLSGGIMAVTNNVQMLGAAFGPAGMAVTALGGALAGILLPRLLETGSIFGKTAEEAKHFADVVRKTSEDAFKPWREMENTKFDVLKGTEKQLDDRLEKMRHDFRLLSQERDAEAAASWNAAGKGLNEEVTVRNARVREIEKQMADITATGQALQKLRPEIKGRDQFDKDADQHFKDLAARDKFEADMKRQQGEKFGTEVQKVEFKIEREREKAIELKVDDEAMKRFEAQAAVDLQKAKIADAEKKLGEMGTPAGMSAGVARDSAEGIKAVNRAISGQQSEQSLAKESLKVDKEQLVKLEEIARAIGNPPPAPVRFALSG